MKKGATDSSESASVVKGDSVALSVHTKSSDDRDGHSRKHRLGGEHV